MTTKSDLPEPTPPEEKDEVLDLSEKWGFENLKARLATGDVLLAQANNLLTLLLGGIGGALALGRTIFDDGQAPAHAWGAAAVAAYWAAVAVVLVVKCIKTQETQMAYNEPGNLYRPETGWSLLRLRRAELKFVQARIEKTKKRNQHVANWLDYCRMAAVLAPVAFSIVAMGVAACR